MLTINFRDTWDGGVVFNQADHRATEWSVLDAVRNAGNRWVFPELLAEDLEPWGGVTQVWTFSVIWRNNAKLWIISPNHRARQQVPGNKGTTATPTAAVVLALFAQVALVQCCIGEHVVAQMYVLQPYYLLPCDVLGLDHSWYEAPSTHEIDQFSQTL